MEKNRKKVNETSVASTSSMSVIGGEELVKKLSERIAPQGKVKEEELKMSLLHSSIKLEERRLYQSSKWVAELLRDSVGEVSVERKRFEEFSASLSFSSPVFPSFSPKGELLSDQQLQFQEASLLAAGKAFFDLKEYMRSWHSLQNCKSQLSFFLASYSLFLAGEAIKQNLLLQNSHPNPHNQPSSPSPQQQDTNNTNNKTTNNLSSSSSSSLPSNPFLHQLKSRYQKASTKTLDSYNLYLYGVVLRELNMPLHSFLPLLLHSIHLDPFLWSAWKDLTKKEDIPSSLLFHLLCSNPQSNPQSNSQSNPQTNPQTNSQNVELKQKGEEGGGRVEEMKALPDHLMKLFFVGHYCLQIQDNQTALLYFEQIEKLVPNSNFVKRQVATALYNLRDFEESEVLFEKVRKEEPFLIDSMDVYSNVLYVKEEKAKLSLLAHETATNEPYRAETNCIIGNYYSLVGEHTKAVLYFQRALKLDSNFLSAWTLMGHEYLELVNYQAAIHAYRKAIELNFRDYRAYYSLGQAYEMLKLYSYAVYYFNKASQLRPYDSRMYVAMASCYESLGKKEQALKCYLRAEKCGDKEGIALDKLAQLYSQLGLPDTAAYYYKKNLDKRDQERVEGIDTVTALTFLAKYCLKIGKFQEAEKYAQRLLDFAGQAKEEGKSILASIAVKRNK